MRRLGVASLKGLDKLAVFEIADLAGLDTDEMTPMHGPGLMAAIERESSSRLHRPSSRRTASTS
jgi:hypothetical protein